MKRALLALITTALVQSALANHVPNHSTASSPASSMSEGEVRRVDKEAKKLTIRHGPLTHLDMPAMTMVFQVQDAAVLEQLKPGDKIRFIAEKVDGSYVASNVEPVR